MRGTISTALTSSRFSFVTVQHLSTLCEKLFKKKRMQRPATIVTQTEQTGNGQQ